MIITRLKTKKIKHTSAQFFLLKNSFTSLSENYNIFNTRQGLLLPVVDRVEFALEELEEKCQEVTVKL